jgi:hypothetical protein
MLVRESDDTSPNIELVMESDDKATVEMPVIVVRGNNWRRPLRTSGISSLNNLKNSRHGDRRGEIWRTGKAGSVQIKAL